jgi:hypothetical protein
MSLWENHQLTFKRIVAILLTTFVFFWMTMDEEDIRYPTVTLEHKCEIALRSLNIPEHVKKQCINLLKDNYETGPD